MKRVVLQTGDLAKVHSSLLAATFLPPRTATLLLAHVLGKSREWVIAHPEAELTAEQHERFAALAEQAASGTPLPYLLGHWEFFGLDFIVTPDVLIPRPETELLVEKALQTSKSQNPNFQIVDVGTGSGIIAVALAVKLPYAHVTATDISPAALVVAKANAEKHNVAGRIAFIQSDLIDGLTDPSKYVMPSSPLGDEASLARTLAEPETPRGSAARGDMYENVDRTSSFNIIAANLPYIPSADLDTLAVAKHEPRLALDGGPDGLSLIRRLLTDAPKVLAPEGTVLLEIEYRQGEAAAALAREAFPDARVEVHKDLAGLDRVVEIGVNGYPLPPPPSVKALMGEARWG